MRVTAGQIKIFDAYARHYFGENAVFWLFGSRVDDSKKGGDYDFLIETALSDADEIIERKIALLVGLQGTPQFEDEKVDIVVKRRFSTFKMPIYEIAMHEGVRIYLSECALHITVLDEGLAEARVWMPLSADTSIGKEMLRVFDQIAYRFAKLQDSMGEKMLPLILELAQETVAANATFTEKLNRLERIETIPSADEWKRFRAIRNALAHEYLDDPELRASAINRFLGGGCEIKRTL